MSDNQDPEDLYPPQCVALEYYIKYNAIYTIFSAISEILRNHPDGIFERGEDVDEYDPKKPCPEIEEIDIVYQHLLGAASVLGHKESQDKLMVIADKLKGA
jgi:hypothetical protein